MASKEKKAPAQEKKDSEMIRRFKQQPFVFIGGFVILIIVVIAFVMPSSLGMDSGMGNVDLTFGFYDKVPIAYVPGNYFAQYFEMLSRWRQDMGQDNVMMNYQIWRESFEAATVHIAMIQEMNRAGYTAPAKVVDREVAQLPQFQENGRFSAALYRQMDENRRLSLWRQVQEEIAKNHFHSHVTGILSPGAEAEFIAGMALVERNFAMVSFSVDDYPESEYEAYAHENADMFRSVHLSMITIGSSEREAQRIQDSIVSGEITFEDAARAHSRDNYADRGGDMGVRMVQDLNFDIPEESARQTVIALAQGELSDVMATADGWFFFRAEENILEADFSDPMIMDRIRSHMRSFQRGRMEDWALEQADAFIALVNDVGFDAALIRQGMASSNFGPIPVNVGNIDLFRTLASQAVSELSDSASNENFWRTAFTTPVNTPSRPLVQGSNVLVLFPTEETQADESDIENIVTNINSFWMRNTTERSLPQYFLTNPRMEDNFMDVFLRYFWGN